LLISDTVDAFGNVVPAARLYALQNSTYSVYALVNDAGTVVERYDYTPYGEVTFLSPGGAPLLDPATGLPRTSSAVGNVYTFTGREFDAETGLMHFRARTYSAKLGRFIQRDKQFRDGMNLYEYVRSRPELFVDPDGDQSESEAYRGARAAQSDKLGGRVGVLDPRTNQLNKPPVGDDAYEQAHAGRVATAAGTETLLDIAQIAGTVITIALVPGLGFALAADAAWEAGTEEYIRTGGDIGAGVSAAIADSLGLPMHDAHGNQVPMTTLQEFAAAARIAGMVLTVQRFRNRTSGKYVAVVRARPPDPRPGVRVASAAGGGGIRAGGAAGNAGEIIRPVPPLPTRRYPVGHPNWNSPENFPGSGDYRPDYLFLNEHPPAPHVVRPVPSARTTDARDVAPQPPAAGNPRSRLPRTNGRWEGTPGNGFWHSDLQDVNEVTGGRPIQFINSRPIFTPWKKGTVKFNPGELKGTDRDFDLVHRSLARQLNLPTKTAAKNWLSEKWTQPQFPKE
jgi:RHS repeat-associated protein